MNNNLKNEPSTKFEKKLIQEEYNVNVAFYIHLKEFNNSVKTQLEDRISEVFLFSKNVEWKFDSFGIEKAGSRSKDVLGYFVFRTTDLTKLQNLFIKEFEDYENITKITCAVAEYQKIKEEFFTLEF